MNLGTGGNGEDGARGATRPALCFLCLLLFNPDFLLRLPSRNLALVNGGQGRSRMKNENLTTNESEQHKSGPRCVLRE